MKNKILSIVITMMMLLVLIVSCGKTDDKSFDSQWYTCSACLMECDDDCYSSLVDTNFYEDNYYLTVLYENKKDSSDKHLRLFKINSQGSIEKKTELPMDCLSGRDSTIVDGKLYTINQNNILSCVNINTGIVERSESLTQNFTQYGVYSCGEGYVLLTSNRIIKYSSAGDLISEAVFREEPSYKFRDAFYEYGDSCYVVCDDVPQLVFYEVDFETGECVRKIGTNDISDGMEFQFTRELAFTYSGVYEVNIDKGEFTPITEWNYVDIRPPYKNADIEQNIAYGNGVFGRIYSYSDGDIELLIFNKANAEEFEGRIPITVGGYGVVFSTPLKWAVYNFNTSREDYRIFLEEYSYEHPYSSSVEAQNRTAELIQFFNDGNAPDIYFGNTFDYRYFYRADMVMNMMPLIEADDDFSSYDIIPSVRDIIFNNGECYQMFAGFIISGDFGLKSVFGEDSNVTYKTIWEMAEDRSISIRGDAVSVNLADQIITYSMADLIDKMSDGHVLAIDELTSIVEYSVNNGISFDAMTNNIADWESVHQGLFLKCINSVGTVYDLNEIEKPLSESFVYLGYPSVYGSAHIVDPDGLVAISSDTEYPDVCWQFIKEMLSDEVQKTELLQNRTPVMQNNLDEMCQYASDPESIPSEDVIMISIAQGKDPVDPRIIDDYLDMVNSIDTITYYDWGLYNIILDEIESYDLQGKTPEEIAQSLQSRLDLYAAENY